MNPPDGIQAHNPPRRRPTAIYVLVRIDAHMQRMKARCLGLALILAPSCWSAEPSTDRAAEIVRESVANTNAGWTAAPQYEFTERDITTRRGKTTDSTSLVTMIEGSPYNKLIARNGQPLSPEEAAEEDRKYSEEVQRRAHESPAARQKRIAEYQKERHQDHALMTEMVKAFEFALVGEETIDGRRCYVLRATPRAGYNAPNRDTEVLKGMRGTMWVDAQEYQWVKVHAEVFRPVTFGLFFARVRPGTEFTFEERPVHKGLWLPSHFSMKVRATVLLISHRATDDDETYTNYHRLK